MKTFTKSQIELTSKKLFFVRYLFLMITWNTNTALTKWLINHQVYNVKSWLSFKPNDNLHYNYTVSVTFQKVTDIFLTICPFSLS